MRPWLAGRCRGSTQGPRARSHVWEPSIRAASNGVPQLVTLVTCIDRDIQIHTGHERATRRSRTPLAAYYLPGPQEPPGRRTYVWRQLKGLGAAYLQQAAAMLPYRPELSGALITLE